VAEKLGVLRMKTKLEDKKRVDVSLVFPACNESENLENAVRKTTQALGEITNSYEIIIAEDGSTDGTDRIAATLSIEYPSVRHIHRNKRLGRGLALKNAFAESNGNILVYMDVDLATDIGHLRALIEAVKGDCDFATGSRMLPESRVSRSVSRQVASKSYNFMVRSFLGSKISDHQCGFKAARREALLETLDEVNATHWFWDTELLVRASRKGYRVKEIPVEWTHRGQTKVRFIKDTIEMGSQVVTLWRKLRTGQERKA
jgi:glycosyltransferase involved in cell wall biosynthesis